MSRQSADASGSANLTQAGRDIAQTTVNIETVNLSLGDLMVANSPKAPEGLPTPISEAIEASGREFLNLLFELIQKHRPDVAEKFASPGMLIATNRAQSAFYESGDDNELADQLSKLLIELAASGSRRRDLKGQSLRLALDILPRLSSEHTNGLCVVSILKYLYVNDTKDAESAFRTIWSSLQPFYGRIPCRGMDYRYIESSGAASHGVIDSGLVGALTRTYQHLLQHYRSTEELQAAIPSDMHHLLEQSPDDPGKSRLSQAGFDETRRYDDFDRGRKLRSVEKETAYATEEIEALINGIDPRFTEMLELLDQTGAMQMDINAAGYAIAFLAWHTNDPKAMSLDEFLTL